MSRPEPLRTLPEQAFRARARLVALLLCGICFAGLIARLYWLQLAAGENASVMLPSSVDASSIVVTVDVPESVEAPVVKGEELGTAILSYADQVIATVPLVASESVAKSELLAGWEQGKSLLTSPLFLVILAVIVALVIVYVILVVFYRRKQRKLRRVRRRRDL